MKWSSDLVGSLSSETVIHLRGSGIAEFLQGQLTCDMRGLNPQQSVTGALCNARGRVLSDLRILQLGDQHCLLRLRREMAATIAETLALYARFSRIDVRADDGSYRIAVATGEPLQTSLARLQLAAPESAQAVNAADGALCLRGPNNSCELIISATASGWLEESPAVEAWWQGAELAAGRYRIGKEDSGEFTPQALNYDRAGYVSFSKGCYTGQEVVARLHYRGQSKRRLALLEAATESPRLARDCRLLDSDGTSLGTILRAAEHPDGGVLYAAMLRDGIASDMAITAEGASTPLTRLPMPGNEDTASA